MNFFGKSRPGEVAPLPQRHSQPGQPRPAPALTVADARTASATSGVAAATGRQSNGLKEFLWQLDGIGRGHLLDLGPARQTTITFFIDRGFKVYTEDLLATWQYFLADEEQRAKKLPSDADRSELTPEGRAKRFLDSTMRYPDDTFDAVLLWDILDYLDNDLMAKLAARVTSLVRDGGVIFAMFHTRKPVLFHRYRVLDAQNLELIPAPCPLQPQRVFQNREISNLFSRYRTSKMFVGRDQLREGLFVK
ncbi:MAG TPA: class I SAM-dependent methyltransferase [Candidatus Acidoferrales bacterium]|jgi:SAM-dependent methyltransferase|nr:class I SAM-dependent methyltransferase [Candidatus Acidoferrales bacterium]